MWQGDNITHLSRFQDPSRRPGISASFSYMVINFLGGSPWRAPCLVLYQCLIHWFSRVSSVWRRLANLIWTILVSILFANTGDTGSGSRRRLDDLSHSKLSDWSTAVICILVKIHLAPVLDSRSCSSVCLNEARSCNLLVGMMPGTGSDRRVHGGLSPFLQTSQSEIFYICRQKFSWHLTVTV